MKFIEVVQRASGGLAREHLQQGVTQVVLQGSIMKCSGEQSVDLPMLRVHEGARDEKIVEDPVPQVADQFLARLLAVPVLQNLK